MMLTIRAPAVQNYGPPAKNKKREGAKKCQSTFRYKTNQSKQK